MRVIQVNPCLNMDNGTERCETPEAGFFGVYLSEHDPEEKGYAGCYEWVADFIQRGHALLFATKLCEQHGYTLENNT